MNTSVNYANWISTSDFDHYWMSTSDTFLITFFWTGGPYLVFNQVIYFFSHFQCVMNIKETKEWINIEHLISTNNQKHIYALQSVKKYTYWWQKNFQRTRTWWGWRKREETRVQRTREDSKRGTTTKTQGTTTKKSAIVKRYSGKCRCKMKEGIGRGYVLKMWEVWRCRFQLRNNRQTTRNNFFVIILPTSVGKDINVINEGI